MPAFLGQSDCWAFVETYGTLSDWVLGSTSTSTMIFEACSSIPLSSIISTWGKYYIIKHFIESFDIVPSRDEGPLVINVRPMATRPSPCLLLAYTSVVLEISSWHGLIVMLVS